MRQERSPYVAKLLAVTQTPNSTGNSERTLRFSPIALLDA